MTVVFGNYDSWLSETFYMEKGKAYDDSDPQVAMLMRRYPDAFGGTPHVVNVEQATAAPGEVRQTARRGRPPRRG